MLSNEDISNVEFTPIRIGNVTKQLFQNREIVCELLPFKGHFPLVKGIRQTGFINATRMTSKFSELPDSIKEEVSKAEIIKNFEDDFIEYLKDKECTSADRFKTLDKDIKRDIIDRWLNANSVPSGMLDLK